ncbi:hypothetical protein [Cyclobacterium sediminis]
MAYLFITQRCNLACVLTYINQGILGTNSCMAEIMYFPPKTSLNSSQP